jgi:hypothetical protein
MILKAELAKRDLARIAKAMHRRRCELNILERMYIIASRGYRPEARVPQN